jgi:hypothetical protein
LRRVQQGIRRNTSFILILQTQTLFLSFQPKTSILPERRNFIIALTWEQVKFFFILVNEREIQSVFCIYESVRSKAQKVYSISAITDFESIRPSCGERRHGFHGHAPSLLGMSQTNETASFRYSRQSSIAR